MPAGWDTTLEGSEEDLLARLERVEHEYEQLRQVIDLAPFYLYAHDWDFNFQMANATVAQVLGYETPDQLEGLNYCEVDPSEEQGQMLLTMGRQTMTEGLPRLTSDCLYIRPADGQAVALDLFEVPYRDAVTGEPRLLGIGIDVSERQALEREQTHRARYESELQTAQRIQESLHPKVPADCPAYEIAGWSEAAEHAGGDYFDWFPLDIAHDLMLCLGDVTGHGLGPAMVASSSRAYGRAVLGHGDPLPERVGKMNRLLAADGTDHFVTMVAVALYRGEGRAEVVSAGHGPILLYRASKDQVSELPTHGLPLGIESTECYDPATEIQFAAGDILLLTSDGFFERSNADGQQFGIRQLIESLGRHAGLSARAMIEAIRHDVETYAGHAPALDDMTALVVKFLGKPEGF